jgi:dienelactone hydrolase
MSDLETLAYRHGDVALTGLLAQPASAPRAAILLFPTIANINAPMERRARMLADLGYVVLVADLYGETPQDMDEARPLANALRADTAFYRARLAAAAEALRAHPAAAGLAIATIGYCMGGQAALEMARDGQDVFAAVSFHGLLETGLLAEPGAIKARLLVCHGDADPLVPRAQVMAFWEEMDRAGANWHFHSYSGVKHGFTDPGSDARGMAAIGYDKSADRQSWSAMLALFDEILSK